MTEPSRAAAAGLRNGDVTPTGTAYKAAIARH